MKKKIAIPSKYHISNFLDLLDIYEKDLEKRALLLRKDAMCYKYIALWKKFKEKSLQSKEKFFSSH